MDPAGIPSQTSDGFAQLPGASSLITRLGATGVDPDLVTVAMHHESALRESPLAPYEIPSLFGILEHLDCIGTQAFTTAAAEFLLRDRGLDEPNEVVTLITGVREEGWRDIADCLDLKSCYRLGKGEEKTGGRNKPSIIMLGARRVLGSVVLSCGFERAKEIIVSSLKRVLPQAGVESGDVKSFLVAFAQRSWGRQPTYEEAAVSGSQHNLTFTYRVRLPDGRSIEGSGPNKKAAETDAARNAVIHFKLIAAAPDYARHFLPSYGFPSSTRGMDTRSFSPAPQALVNARALGSQLAFQDIDPTHLAIALTSANWPETNFTTHSGHKLLGSLVEDLAFHIFAFDVIPSHFVMSYPLVSFRSAVVSAEAQAALYDFLKLERYVFSGPSAPFGEERKADVIQSIVAAVYLSKPSFRAFYDWIVSKLGGWLYNTILDLCINPARLSEPKSKLQELIQSGNSFSLSYRTRCEGPEHRPSYYGEVALHMPPGRALTLATGMGNTKRKAEQDAAKNALRALSPNREARPLPASAVQFWTDCFQTAIERSIALRGIGGIENFRALNSFEAYLDLKAFSASLGGLASWLERTELLRTIVRSIGLLAPFSIKEARELALQGVELFTSVHADETDELLSPARSDWLEAFRRVAVSLRLPRVPIVCPTSMVGADGLKRLRLENIQLVGCPDADMPESMFTHLVTLLECLDNVLSTGTSLELKLESRSDWSQLALLTSIGGSFGLPLRKTIWSLVPHAFFSGVQDIVSNQQGKLQILVRGVCAREESRVATAFSWIINELFQGQQHINDLYGVLHGLKNQVLAIQNHALNAKENPAQKFQCFGRIEQIQHDIRAMQVGLRTYFDLLEPKTPGTCNLKKEINDFVSRELSTIPSNIQLRLDIAVDPEPVNLDAAMLFGLLDNLVKNAVAAMPTGGELSLLALYNRRESTFLLEVGDTGRGIGTTIRESIASTQFPSKGMGLGLAIVTRIVHQCRGSQEWKSEEGRGTKVVIELPVATENQPNTEA